MIFSGVTILQGVEFPIFLLIFECALQRCSAIALPVIGPTQTTEDDWTVKTRKYATVWCGEGAMLPPQKILEFYSWKCYILVHFIRSNHYLWPLVHWGVASLPRSLLKYAFATHTVDESGRDANVYTSSSQTVTRCHGGTWHWKRYAMESDCVRSMHYSETSTVAANTIRDAMITVSADAGCSSTAHARVS